MPSIEVNGVTIELPPDDSQSSKVPQYNEALIALAAALATGVAWASWTPTWTNLTLGDGVVVAKYARIGKLVICRLSVTLGSTSLVGGTIIFSLPVNREAFAGTDDKNPLGQARLFDTSAPATFEGVIVSSAVGTALVAVHDSSGTYLVATGTGASVPFSWATGDEISAQFMYEAA